MRIAAYLRFSTDHYSHKSQRAELDDYCQRRGWREVRWFTDTASGAKSDREGLSALTDQVHRGKVGRGRNFELYRLAHWLPQFVTPRI